MALIGGMLAQAALAEQDRRFRQNQFDKQMDLRERQLSQQDDQFNKSLSLQRSRMAPMMYEFGRMKQDDIILDQLADTSIDYILDFAVAQLIGVIVTNLIAFVFFLGRLDILRNM